MTPRPLSAAETFDTIGIRYQQGYSHLPEQLAAIDWLLDRLPAAATVLDIGSGTGKPTAELLAAAGHRVTGCDVSPTMVDLARQQVPSARFDRADVRELPDIPGRWDAITAFFPLMQMSHADLDNTVTRIAGWLKPGGYFVFCTVPFAGELEDAIYLGLPVQASSYSKDEFLRLFARAGLTVLHAQESTFQPDLAEATPERHLFVYATRDLRP
ncbi:class I SAM-dependent methyltransferase [Pseudonocardiaceae bacterium YIM PH 21723]|nr:class I SAM-dependent methyltransferase [Pseudonocardiaceae bacterium YIM PH 21723]